VDEKISFLLKIIFVDTSFCIFKTLESFYKNVV